MAQVFVKGVKELKELLKDARRNENKIKEIVSGMVKSSANALVLANKYDEAVDKVSAVIAATGSGTRVHP